MLSLTRMSTWSKSGKLTKGGPPAIRLPRFPHVLITLAATKISLTCAVRWFEDNDPRSTCILPAERISETG